MQRGDYVWLVTQASAAIARLSALEAAVVEARRERDALIRAMCSVEGVSLGRVARELGIPKATVASVSRLSSESDSDILDRI